MGFFAEPLCQVTHYDRRLHRNDFLALIVDGKKWSGKCHRRWRDRPRWGWFDHRFRSRRDDRGRLRSRCRSRCWHLGGLGWPGRGRTLISEICRCGNQRFGQWPEIGGGADHRFLGRRGRDAGRRRRYNWCNWSRCWSRRDNDRCRCDNREGRRWHSCSRRRFRFCRYRRGRGCCHVAIFLLNGFRGNVVNSAGGTLDRVIHGLQLLDHLLAGETAAFG